MSGISPRKGDPVNRGGTTLTTGRIGKLKVLRQTMMQPGETIKARVNGSVKMEMLRERDALRLNAHMAHFMTPVRWLWDQWPQYVKEGPTTALVPPTINTKPGFLGLGGDIQVDIHRWWSDAVFRIYNEWYKWPENPDSVPGTLDALDCVNLEHSWTRCRDKFEPVDASDKEVASATTLSIQDLAEVQARFQSAMNREIFSFDRYQEVLDDMWGVDGSREVDKVPILIGNSQIGVNPRSLPATDSAGFGQWASIYDFSVDDSFTITAPEHCIITSVMLVRFAPITEERHPLSNIRMSWAETVGDPYILGAMRPQPVEIRDCIDSTATEVLGYLPAGWQWRSENNDIGFAIDARDSFPYMKLPTNTAEARNASLRMPAFRSASLEDFVADLYFNYKSRSLIPSEMSSYTAGMNQGGSKQPYTKVRKVK